jgi:peptide/nickel transport system substrate-binding protein
LGWCAQIRRGVPVVLVALLLTASVRSAARPQYGGVLRVELRTSSVTLHPSRWKAGSPEYAANSRLAELMFERLVSLDNYGRFQPQLATEWSSDATGKRWQFTLRPGVKFSDGTPLTANDVVAALQGMLPKEMQIAATAIGVVIQAASPANDLLEMLASGPYFVYRSEAKGGLIGTGPFVLETSLPEAAAGKESGSNAAAGQAQHLRFRFNEQCWSGRPFVDAIEVTLGVPPLRALLDVQLGKADVAELSEDTARRAQQSNLKLWASAPLTMYGLRFGAPAKSENVRTLREALSFSLDRNAMAGVLLQKQAEPAASFLPQWLSGYAFLYEVESNLERARELRASLPANAVGAAQPLRVGVDGGNELAKLIAERVVVNARAAGIALQIISRGAAHSASDGGATKLDSEAQVLAWRYTSLSARDALQNLALLTKSGIPEGGMPGDADARYAWEKRMMDEKNIVPLVAVPDFAAVDQRVRNWSPAPWGEWRFADVWIDQGAAAAGPGNAAKKMPAGARP